MPRAHKGIADRVMTEDYALLAPDAKSSNFWSDRLSCFPYVTLAAFHAERA